ncbi:MAG: glycosyltransferase family 4 protein [Bacteroidales bacterium]|nr:glycosyltransferase family 4 protein [Bacteroidales bacterium]
MKILQICHKMPFPLFDGGALSIYNTALGLISQKADIKVFALNTPRNWVDPKSIPDDFKEKARFEYSIVNTRLNPLHAFLDLFSNKSYFVERFFSKEFSAHLIQILNDEEFDIVQLEHLYMCLYIDTIRKYSKAKVILRPQNVENKVWKRYLKNKINLVSKICLRIATNRLNKFEKDIACKVDGIIAISPEDANLFSSYAPETPLTDIPMGFDFDNISNYDVDQQYNDFPVFYHLGSMDWLPNVQSIKWFIEEVIHFVKEEYPDFKFRIAGKKMPQWFFKRQNKNLIVDGEIIDALNYQEDKAIMIVPLLSGGGIRVKIIEGMALGKTIISTSIGAEGIPYADQKNILIANNKEEFVKQIGKCFHSKEFCKEIGREAQILAKGNYDFNKTAKKMMRFYNSLI